MSHARRDYYRRKLARLTQHSDDEDFFIMIWAIHAVQSDRSDKARPFLDFPPEAMTSDITSEFAVHPWASETLLNEVLTTPKRVIKPGRKFRTLNCSSFSTIVRLVNALTKLENAEDGLTLRRVNVLRELHRISQRQFDWQRGFVTLANIYRSSFIYGGQETKQFFLDHYGFTLDEFTLVCFALYASFLDKPGVLSEFDLNSVGIPDDIRTKIFDHISLPHEQARKTASLLRAAPCHIAYKPSFFRRYPCVLFDKHGSQKIIAPLPDLVTLRATSGLFYDMAGARGNVKNEIAERFEDYCIDLISEMLPDCNAKKSFSYQIKKGQRIESPDILIEADEVNFSVVIECKARRLNYEARFSENPVADADYAYREIGKGIFQIWRYVSHCRRGLAPKRRNNEYVGILLTLDTWMSGPSSIRDDVFGVAEKLAAEHLEVEAIDRVPVVFCPIVELEQTLNECSHSSFFEALGEASKEEFKGWSLWGVHNRISGHETIAKDFPFEDRIESLLPWWGKF